MKILKQEKGSVTLFVLIAMLFFVMFLVGLYIVNSNGEATSIAETKRIKEIYEQGINNIDDVYITLVNKQKVNAPYYQTSGLIPVKILANGSQVEVSGTSDWYNYDEREWANAKTKDGSLWVWIPRFAYKITYTDEADISKGGTIDVVFLKDTTNLDFDGNDVTSTSYIDKNGKTGAYIVHPAFKNGTLNNFQNGEWDKEITGFWVAKYAAGFQASTTDASDATKVINSTDTVIYSNKNYTAYNSNTPTNALGQTLTSNANPPISYPVFKPLTYAYNNISGGDSYTIVQEISKASNFYGLNNIDSHMMKNSEWGAVAYLTQSSYGRNGSKLTINSKNLNNLNSKNIYAVTGYAESTANGVSASSTNNMSGVFDLSGCIWERIAGYITNGNANLLTYGNSSIDTAVDENGYKTRSTKYLTVYPFNAINNTNDNNYNVYKSLQSITYGYGDAILETSTLGSGTRAWNSNSSYFLRDNSLFFARGGNCDGSTSSGMFAFAGGDGAPYFNSGFRAVLIVE